MRGWRVLALGVSAAVMAATCGGGSTTQVEDPPGDMPMDTTSTSETPTEIRIVVADRGVPGVGGTLQIRVDGVGASGVARPAEGVSWVSEDTSILTIDAAGLVTGVAEGTAWVRATLGDLQDREQLWVGQDVSGEVAIVGATVLPMDGSAARPNQTVLISGTTITAIGNRDGINIPASAQVVDAAGRYLIPGLTDAHAHPRTEEDLLPYVANGVTTIINLGHPAVTPMMDWRNRINGGALLGPTIYTTGQIIDGATPRGVATIVTTPEAGRQVVRDQIAAGVDFLKVYNSLDTATFQAIMNEARQAGVSVIGHGVRAPGLDGILDAGLDAIAHAEEIFYTHFSSNIDASLIPSAVQKIAASGTWVMPNLSTFERVALQWGNTPALNGWLAAPENRFIHPVHKVNWLTFHQNSYANRTGSVQPIQNFLITLTTALHDGGVPLLLATDSPIIPGMYPGYSIHEDLRLLVSAGLTPTEALIVGTANGGRFIAQKRRGAEVFGTITVGQRADLVLLDADPTMDMGTLRTPRGVMVRGRFLSRVRLQQLLEDLAAGF